jgi:SAM-dependent methyltransferase
VFGYRVEMSIRARALVIGIATYVPGVRRLSGRNTGGTVSARYCYSAWLRHLWMLHRSALPIRFDTMVELGPGDSLGIGLAALLSGVQRYIALDVVAYASQPANLQVFDELIALFTARAPIPDPAEFPLLVPPLPSYAFPPEILDPARLEMALYPGRLELIRAAITNPATAVHKPAPLAYIAPWNPAVIETSSVDLVLSQSVLEFPPDLPHLYSEMCRWLKPGGVLSHEIDFKSLGVTSQWNGHWACSDALWRLAVGRRRHKLNREPHSTHISLIEGAGCRVVCDECIVRPSQITRAQLAPRFRHLTDQDLRTDSALIQAIKPALSEGYA